MTRKDISDLEKRTDALEGDGKGLTNDELGDVWRDALDPETPDPDEFESREAYLDSVLGEGRGP